MKLTNVRLTRSPPARFHDRIIHLAASTGILSHAVSTTPSPRHAGTGLCPTTTPVPHHGLLARKCEPKRSQSQNEPEHRQLPNCTNDLSGGTNEPGQQPDRGVRNEPEAPRGTNCTNEPRPRTSEPGRLGPPKFTNELHRGTNEPRPRSQSRNEPERRQSPNCTNDLSAGTNEPSRQPRRRLQNEPEAPRGTNCTNELRPRPNEPTLSWWP